MPRFFLPFLCAAVTQGNFVAHLFVNWNDLWLYAHSFISLVSLFSFLVLWNECGIQFDYQDLPSLSPWGYLFLTFHTHVFQFNRYLCVRVCAWMLLTRQLHAEEHCELLLSVRQKLHSISGNLSLRLMCLFGSWPIKHVNLSSCHSGVQGKIYWNWAQKIPFTSINNFSSLFLSYASLCAFKHLSCEMKGKNLFREF